MSFAVASILLVVVAQTQSPNPPPLLDDTPLRDPASDPVGDAPPVPDPAEDDGAPLPEFARPIETPTKTDPATTPSTTTTMQDPSSLRIRLVYSPGPWAGVCPSLDDVRDSIQAHLGYDPFGEPADRVVLLLLDTVNGVEGDHPDRARVELLDQQLKSLGTRSVTSTEGCGELTATAALQVSIAVDPARIAGPRPIEPVDPAAPTGTTTLRPVPRGPVTPPTEPAPLVLQSVNDVPGFFGVDGHIAVGVAPQDFMFGGTAYAGLRWEWLSGRAEFRIDFPGDDRGTTSVPLLLSAVPCAHIPISKLGPDEEIDVSTCGTLTGGVIPVFGTYNGLGIYAGVGARVGLDWRFDDTSAIRGFMQLEGAALRPQYESSNAATFTTPPLNIMIGIGVDLPAVE